MEKVPYSKYTKELRLEAVRLVTEGGLSVGDASMRLSLPKSIIQQLGLTPLGKAKSMTANGIVERTVYSEVKFTILGRSGSLQITDLPDGAPVLVGHLVMEMLDLCLDIKRGLIYNPAHGNEWIEEQF